MEEYFSQLWIMYCITRFLITVVHWFKILSVCIMKVFIDWFWTDHISWYKRDLSYTTTTHFVLCLLLSNDKFYIHSGGSLEY
jgi:hypothetical protein